MYMMLEDNKVLYQTENFDLMIQAFFNRLGLRCRDETQLMKQVVMRSLTRLAKE